MFCPSFPLPTNKSTTGYGSLIVDLIYLPETTGTEGSGVGKTRVIVRGAAERIH